jgi:hypothetical protein
MNMSHPNFLAIAKRFENSLFSDIDSFLKKNKLKTFLGMNFLLLQFMLFKKFNFDNINVLLQKTDTANYVDRIKNLMASVENEVGNLFLMMEECLWEHVMINGKIVIGNKSYDKVILTPLIIDFGVKTAFYRNVHYNRKPVAKPVIEQTIDLFNGISKYNTQSPHKIFEIYPFMGINTINYTINEIDGMLNKHFGNYMGTHESFRSNMSVFSGDVKSSGSNIYSGIKLYPLLGFDPWPHNTQEKEKVMLLYDFCQSKQIPITSHISDVGFCIIDEQNMETLTSPLKWKKVLNRYPSLKLNLAHFGKKGKSTEWQNEIINLIKTYDNVYTDISYRGFDDSFYKDLKNIVKGLGNKKNITKLKDRILFGSDFMINLLETDSYCKYYDLFISTKHFSENDKNLMCSLNPQSFLFSQSPRKRLQLA